MTRGGLGAQQPDLDAVAEGGPCACAVRDGDAAQERAAAAEQAGVQGRGRGEEGFADAQRRVVAAFEEALVAQVLGGA
ncbi:hypothetical protein [Streptomyces sp. NPDC005486]|uniref:hypothetical protein n=1 Tax=Streptomyces sp. NPDC005486 TaxID=3155345 RepID=UPI0033B214C3